MLLALIIIFVITILYLSITERFRYYAMLIAVQGWILFFIAILRLHSSNVTEIIFILTETLLVKGLITPLLLFNIINRTGVNHVHKGSIPSLNSLILFFTGLIASIVITYYINDNKINTLFFAVALYALISGLILITTHKRIFSHLIGFLIIENGVFLFSMAVGIEMPLLINTVVLIDVLISVLLLGLFLNKIGDKLHNLNSDELSRLKN
ncbi:MAG: hypothetical protein LIO79_05360 [Rikenellaceae bacterium]|nr:hypothetical protein [Rikenellaceae bacterium]